MTTVCFGQGGGNEKESSGPPPTPVRVGTVQTQQLQEKRMVTGDLRALRRSDVATQEAGLVIARNIDEGQEITKSEQLVKLKDSRLSIQLRSTEADLAAQQAVVTQREAELEQMQYEVRRYRELFEKGGGNERELRDAESAAAVAKAKLEAAKRQIEVIHANAQLLRTRIDDLTIKAPFDGIVVSISAELGEWIGEGNTVLELIAVDPIEAWLRVPQSNLAAVKDEKSIVTVEIEATGKSIDAKEKRIIPEVDPKARTFTLVARFDNSERLLSPGMSVTAWVPTEQLRERLTVPRNAVLRSDAGAYVYLVKQISEDGFPQAVQAPVQVDFPVGYRVVVRSNRLSEGDEVVVEGNERLFPMTPLKIKRAENKADLAAKDTSR